MDQHLGIKVGQPTVSQVILDLGLDEFQFNLTIRATRPGERLVEIGMTFDQKRSLSEARVYAGAFDNEKLERLRQKLPVLIAMVANAASLNKDMPVILQDVPNLDDTATGPSPGIAPLPGPPRLRQRVGPRGSPGSTSGTPTTPPPAQDPDDPSRWMTPQ